MYVKCRSISFELVSRTCVVGGMVINSSREASRRVAALTGYPNPAYQDPAWRHGDVNDEFGDVLGEGVSR